MNKVVMDENKDLGKFNFNNLFNVVKEKISSKSESDDDKLLGMLKEAHKEWEEAESYFQMVSEPDLIDYAIHRMEATKTKYMYLLKQVREKELTSKL